MNIIDKREEKLVLRVSDLEIGDCFDIVASKPIKITDKPIYRMCTIGGSEVNTITNCYYAFNMKESDVEEIKANTKVRKLDVELHILS